MANSSTRAIDACNAPSPAKRPRLDASAVVSHQDSPGLIEGLNKGNLMIRKEEFMEIYQESRKLRLICEFAKQLENCNTAAEVVRVRELPQFACLQDDHLASFIRARTSEVLHFKDHYLECNQLLKEEREEHEQLKKEVATRQAIRDADFLVPIVPREALTEDMLEAMEEVVIFDVQPVDDESSDPQPGPSTGQLPSMSSMRMVGQNVSIVQYLDEDDDNDELEAPCKFCSHYDQQHPCLEFDLAAKMNKLVDRLAEYRFDLLDVNQKRILRSLEMQAEKIRRPNVTDAEVKGLIQETLQRSDLLKMADILGDLSRARGDRFEVGKREKIRRLIGELRTLHKELIAVIGRFIGI